jgi:hypothetical protein
MGEEVPLLEVVQLATEEREASKGWMTAGVPSSRYPGISRRWQQ